MLDMGVAATPTNAGTWVCFLMNRFRKLGFFEYSGRIWIRKSLASVLVNDDSPGGPREKPGASGPVAE